jgi:hypothetical protein
LPIAFRPTTHQGLWLSREPLLATSYFIAHEYELRGEGI